MTAIVYTAIAGAYPIKRPDVRCFMGGEVFQRPVMEAKRYKVLSHLFNSEDVTIWTDANIWLQVDPDDFAREALGHADLAVFEHPYRATVWQEFAALREQQRFRIPYLQKQLAEQEGAYRDAGLPWDAPLYECSVLVRRNKPGVHRLMESWWAQICRWQWRDQVSLPFVLWQLRDTVSVSVVRGHNPRSHPAFRYVSQY